MGWKYLVFALVALVLLEAALAQVDLPHHHAPQPPRRKQGKHSFHHTEEEIIPLYVIKIGPYSNPSETYDYYSLPFCRPEGKIQHRHKNFKDSLGGDLHSASAYEFRFKVDVPLRTLCTMEIGIDELRDLRDAIAHDYYYEFRFDAIPLRGFLGAVNTVEVPHQVLLYKHTHFTFFYNGDQVIYGNITADLYRVQELKDEPTESKVDVEFTYSVQWLPTTIPFRHRLKLIDDNFFSRHSKQELEIHWLSIMNSFVLVVLLTGFIAIIIMRVLKGDYTRYAKADQEEDAEDYGWKLVHGDVFRFPQHKLLLSAFVGNGSQFLFLTLLLLTLEVVGVFYGTNNSLVLAALISYAFTAGMSGFAASRLYKQLGGEKWAWLILVTTGVFAAPFFMVALVVNIVAAAYGTTTSVPIASIIKILSLWIFIGVPLTFTGGIVGKRSAGEFYAPVRTKNFKREIPPIPWYRRAPLQYLMSGFLPFSAIYIELYYVYAAVWGHYAYTLYGILFLVFVILVIVTACITIALTYFQLSMEDHEWWWRSFISGGSTGFFIVLYSVFYWLYRSKMTGFLQAIFYFGYMTVIGYFFFLMLGTVGWFSALIFVRRIYSNLKCD